VPAPATAYWDLFLRGYGENNTDLVVTLDVRDNTLFTGTAVSNQVQHIVTAQDLKFAGDGLTGTLFVATNQVTINARYSRGVLTGTYNGGKGTRLTGRVTAR
jgi:hypothetical protein